MAEDRNPLGGLGEPRPLSPASRSRLEARLTADDLAVTLSETAGPRALPPALRAALVAQLVTPRTGAAWRRPGAALAAAASVAVVVAGAVLLGPPDRPSGPVALPGVSATPGETPDLHDVVPGRTGSGPPLGFARSTPAPPAAPGRYGVAPTPASGTAADRGAGPVAAAGAPMPSPAASPVAAAPEVGSLDPSTGPVAGGNTVMVGGSGFTAGSEVHFGVAAAQTVEVVSSTLLRVVAPAHLPGSVHVTVTTAQGRSAASEASAYTYTP